MKALLVALAVLSAPAYADDFLKKDDVLEITAEVLPLRPNTPNSELGTRPKPTAWVKQGELVKVVSLKQIPAITGTELWVEFQKADDASVHGWFTAGLNNEALSGLAHPSAAKPADPEE